MRRLQTGMAVGGSCFGFLVLAAAACSSGSTTDGATGAGGETQSSGGQQNLGGASSGTGGGLLPGTGGAGSTAAWGAADNEPGGGAPAPSGYSSCATSGAVSKIGNAWDTENDSGPNDHNTLYGARPRLVAATRGDGSFDFAWQESEPADVLHVSHVEKSGESYATAWTVSAPSLGQVGGLAITEGGDPLLVTAIEEAISGSTTPLKTHRDGILQVFQLKDDCSEAYREELRTDFADPSQLPVYQPFQAGSSRLTVGGGKFVLHYAQMTEYDDGVKSRHQIGRVLQGNVSDGKLTQERGSISHSFDQRTFFDGQDFILAALGDASHRGIEVSRLTTTGEKTNRNIFSVKGGSGDTGGGYNNTFTRLGGSASSKNGYLHVFSTEAGNVITERVNVSRNLAVVHTPKDFDTIAQPEQYVVTVSDTKSGNPKAESWDVSITDYWNNSYAAKNSEVAFVTDYKDVAAAHVERPKLVRWGEGAFFVLWEKWSLEDYVETFAAIVDEYGNILVAPKTLGKVRLSRGDDAFLLSGKAAWLESHGGKVYLHTVDPELQVTTSEL